MPWAASNRKSQGPVLWLSHAGAAGFAAFPHSRGMTSAIVGIASAFVVGKEEPVAPGASILSEKRKSGCLQKPPRAFARAVPSPGMPSPRPEAWYRLLGPFSSSRGTPTHPPMGALSATVINYLYQNVFHLCCPGGLQDPQEQ